MVVMGKIKRIMNKNGETLVETVVSFALISIVLLSLALILRTSIAANTRAQDNMMRINADSNSIEAEIAATQDAQLHFNFAVGSDSKSYTLDAEMLTNDNFYAYKPD